MTDYPPPAPSPRPLPPPSQLPASKDRSHKLTAIVGAVALVLGIAIGYAAHGQDDNAGGGRSSAAAAPSDSEELVPSEAETSEATSVQPELAPSDFTIEIKIREKMCFGSAGCNLTYRIDPDYTGVEDVTTGSWDITYVVKGTSDGTSTNTMTLSDGTFSFDGEEFAQTDSKSDKLTAKVTSVEIAQ